jgi:Ca2+-transporting ATPase
MNGANILTPPGKISLWKLFFEKFEDPVIRMLLFIAFISLGISYVEKDFTESIGILIAIFLATGVAFWFEYDANKKFNILNLLNNETPYKVYRNGGVTQVPKSDIVIGDIVIVETGEEIPADGILIEAIALQVDESTLTGEPITYKSTDHIDDQFEGTYPSNLVLRGTKVMDGHGIFEVNKVGDSTEFGKVARKSTEITNEETPLNKQLSQLARFIGVVGTVMAVATFGILMLKEIAFRTFTEEQLGIIAIIMVSMTVGLTKIWMSILYDLFHLLGYKRDIPKFVRRTSWFAWLFLGALTFVFFLILGFIGGIDIFNPEVWIPLDLADKILHFFMISVTLVVVAVPEGLPMSVTLSLAMSMRRMLASNNLVRKMHACETMGAATVICTDKTGTLTQNRMEVFETIINTDSFSAELFAESIAINSTAYLDYTDKENVRNIGNPTEAALLLWLYNNGTDYLPIREKARVIAHLSFSTERKYMATIAESPLLNKKKVLYVKGAPEIVLSLCKNIALINPEVNQSYSTEQVQNMLLQYQSRGMRTLGFAFEIIEDEEKRISGNLLTNTNLTFIGFAAISDPVRDDVPQAVIDCINAGIDVKIVTGDTYGTAVEVARQIGIWKDHNTINHIITGQEFEKLSDEEVRGLAGTLKVMYRARPTDKQRLVQALQLNKEVVAVTGDGTNDAPALNHAHVGLSMGSGTYVAKEASDITLTDDSFRSIASAVMWGRSIYENIQRFILFQLTINFTALLVVFIGSVLGSELPLTVTQMLWVNLIMDTFAAAALASLPPNKEVMKKKPRNNDAFIINPEMRKSIFTFGISFVIILLILLMIYSKGGSFSRYDLTKYFTFFVLLQFWNLFNAKSFLSDKSAFSNIKRSYGFLIIAAIILVGQFLIVQFGGDVFRTTPLGFKDWFILLSSTSIVLWAVEIKRLFLKK